MVTHLKASFLYIIYNTYTASKYQQAHWEVSLHAVQSLHTPLHDTKPTCRHIEVHIQTLFVLDHGVVSELCESNHFRLWQGLLWHPRGHQLLGARGLMGIHRTHLSPFLRGACWRHEPHLRGKRCSVLYTQVRIHLLQAVAPELHK